MRPFLVVSLLPLHTFGIMTTNSSCMAFSADNPNQYGYGPSLGAGITFCTLFGVSMALHTLQVMVKRQFWALVFVIGALSQSLLQISIFHCRLH